MTATSDPSHRAAEAAQSAPAAPPEPRQRWRLTFARDLPPGDVVPTGREYIGRWEEALVDAGLPVVETTSGRPRIALGAPLPSGCSADGEILEFWLTERRPAWAVREGLDSTQPDGHRAVSLESVWLGAPPLSGQIAAADYELAARTDGHDAAAVDAAARRLLARDRLPRQRQKGSESKAFDLRPLIVSLDVDSTPGDDVVLRMRTRIHPELGTGRPDDIVGALSDELGGPVSVQRTVRRRLLLAGDLED